MSPKRTKPKPTRTTPTPTKEPFVPSPPTPTTAAKNLMERRDRALAILARLDNATCAELGRRARGAPRDGYPASSNGNGAVSTSEVSRPTERSAVANIEEPDPADPVGDAISEVFATMAECVGLLANIDRKRGYILATGDDKRGRVSSLGSCQACTRDVACTPEDRLRAGFCEACHKAWTRAERPERVGWIRERRAVLEVV